MRRRLIREMGLFIGFIAIVLLLPAVPFEKLMSSKLDKVQIRGIRAIIGGTLSVFFCVLVALKSGIANSGGFRNGVLRNYWMVLLPLIFPGTLIFSNFRTDCQNGIFGLTLIVATYLVKALIEECAFRGVVQGYLLKYYPNWTMRRICFTGALLFSLLHLVNLRHHHSLTVGTQLVYAFYLGLLFGAIVIRTNNVWLVGTVHGLINFISVPCSYTNEMYVEELTELPNLWDWIQSLGSVAVLLSPILIMFLLLLPKKRKIKDCLSQV